MVSTLIDLVFVALILTMCEHISSCHLIQEIDKILLLDFIIFRQLIEPSLELVHIVVTFTHCIP